MVGGQAAVATNDIVANTTNSAFFMISPLTKDLFRDAFAYDMAGTTK